ncbi:MAG: tripartite tricarboxylate transporter family receptor, partial [Hyphomicrobiales bacterium]|nr:tripartite tricarboxylate transporter family receptor [Hyphomicrobiales bacterium]
MRIKLAAALILAALVPGGTVKAADADSFFAGKTIRILVGYPPGSTFDNYARLATRHIGRHIPGNPTVIVQNMPGAGGLTATSNAANVAAPDGLTLALINPVNAMEPILNPDVAKFDARRFKWIGSMNSEVGTCGFWNDKIRSLDDLKSTTATLGATGPSSGSTLDAKAIQGILGLNFKMVLGYPGLNDVRLAAENKEVDGFCGLQVSAI